MLPLRGLTWKGTAYICTVVVLSGLIIPLGIALHPVAGAMLPTLLYLSVFTQVAALMPIKWRHGYQTLTGLPLVAVGLAAPGAVGIVAWLFLHDGRRPSAETPIWRLMMGRATMALGYGVSSLLVAPLPLPSYIDVPVKSLLLGAGGVVIALPLTAGGFSFLLRQSFWSVLAANTGIATARSAAIMALGGGALYLLLKVPAGYAMGLGFLGILIAIRSNMADAQRQEVERLQTLELLAQALDARDPLTELHSQRVSEMAMRLGEILELRPLEVERLRIAGLLHDIGKIGVRDSILKKSTGLTSDEWAEMRSHADRGADMIAKHSALAPIAPWVRYHHERIDGSGYPDGKAGEDIPLGARIIAVADSYDTITGARVYRSTTLTPREAVLDISRSSGQWYDPEVVNALRGLHKMPPLRGAKESHLESDGAVGGGLHLLWRRRRFGWLTSGMAVSSIGDPLTSVALVITVYAVTRNPFLVGLTYALRGIATVATASLLGGAADGWDRRRVVMASDLIRCLTLLTIPFSIRFTPLSVFVAIPLLAGAEAIGQSAREAAMPELLQSGEVSVGNAIIGTAVMVASAVGYPLAALVLWIAGSTTPLFILDAATFAAAAALSLQIGNVGGGVRGRRITGAFRAAWHVAAARAPLMLSGATAFFMSMMLPTLVILAYQVSGQGARIYTLLALLTTAGMIAGNILMTRQHGWSVDRTAITGLIMMAVFSVAVAVSPWLLLTAIMLFIASAGNSVYVVGNRSALQETVTSASRGSVMVTRFVVTQTALILGSGIGGALAGRIGARSVYGVLGVGLIVLAAVAFASRRRQPNGDSLEGGSVAPEVTLPVRVRRAPASLIERR